MRPPFRARARRSDGRRSYSEAPTITGPALGRRTACILRLAIAGEVRILRQDFFGWSYRLAPATRDLGKAAGSAKESVAGDPASSPSPQPARMAPETGRGDS